MRGVFGIAVALALAAGLGISAQAQESADDLAKQLSNPVASLISVPFQFNADFGAADDRAQSYNLKIQPVIPIPLNSDWNLISRTIMPIVGNVGFPTGDVWGLADTTQSFFLSPSNPGPGGLIWGVGPIFSLPTATDPTLGSGKWGIGPTAVLLKQTGPWTIGALVSHTWSFAGPSSEPDVSSSYMQPFLSYAFGKGRTVTLNTETTYDWLADQWTVPLNLTYSKVFRVGNQNMSWVVGGRYYATAPEGGPVWGLRAGLTLLFPTK